MEYYQAHRLKKIGTSVWLAETEKLLSRMEQLDDQDTAVQLLKNYGTGQTPRGKRTRPCGVTISI